VYTAKVKVQNVNTYAQVITKDGVQKDAIGASLSLQIENDTANTGLFAGAAGQGFSLNLSDVDPAEVSAMTGKKMTLTLSED